MSVSKTTQTRAELEEALGLAPGALVMSPLNEAWAQINALGGYVRPDDVAGQAYNEAVLKALNIIESLGGNHQTQPAQPDVYAQFARTSEQLDAEQKLKAAKGQP